VRSAPHCAPENQAISSIQVTGGTHAAAAPENERSELTELPPYPRLRDRPKFDPNAQKSFAGTSPAWSPVRSWVMWAES
jgi:hypothetical protein